MARDSGEGIKTFSPELFNLVVEQVIVGIKEGKVADPYRLIFVFKSPGKKPNAAKNGGGAKQPDADLPAIIYSLLEGKKSLGQENGDVFLDKFERIADLNLFWPHCTFLDVGENEKRKEIRNQIAITAILDLR